VPARARFATISFPEKLPLMEEAGAHESDIQKGALFKD
jgi:hypothetical protein